MKINEKIILSLFVLLAMTSFTFPRLFANYQDKNKADSLRFVEIDNLTLDSESEITINETEDLSIIYEIVTSGTKSLQNISQFQESLTFLPSELFNSINEEISYFQERYILPKAQFFLLETPTLLRFDSERNGSLLVWEYFFTDEEANILTLLYHAKTGKILSLDYENKVFEHNENGQANQDLTEESYPTYLTEPDTFSYLNTMILPIYHIPPQILKTELRLYDSGYSIMVWKKIS